MCEEPEVHWHKTVRNTLQRVDWQKHKIVLFNKQYTKKIIIKNFIQDCQKINEINGMGKKLRTI